MKKLISTGFLLMVVFIIQTISAHAQSTEFTYQGSLNTGATPSTGNHDFEFALFSAVTAGTQLGTTVTVSNVAVTNGIFSAKIDFGNQFAGAARFLEIRVRQTGGGAFTTLTPRQAVSSAPYSVKSLTADNAVNATTATNATQLNGQAAAFYQNATNITAGTLNAARLPVPLELTGTRNGSQIILGQNTSPTDTSTGVAGVATAATGITNGVWGQSGSTSGRGVYGLATATTGTTYGVYGWSNSPDGFGGHFVGRGYFSGNVGIGTQAPNHQLTVGPTETPVITNASVGVYRAGATYSIVRDTTNDVEGLFGAEISGVLYGSMTNHRVALRTNNVDRITIAPTGEVAIITPGAAGTTALCRNNSNEISLCSSSLRYKTNIGQFSPGLSFINKLQPISFDWKDGGMKDVGFGAEDVAKIDPRFVTYNGQGEIEGVKYDRVGVVLVNAVNEQQMIIEAQQRQIDELKLVVCQISPTAKVCQK